MFVILKSFDRPTPNDKVRSMPLQLTYRYHLPLIPIIDLTSALTLARRSSHRCRQISHPRAGFSVYGSIGGAGASGPCICSNKLRLNSSCVESPCRYVTSHSPSFGRLSQGTSIGLPFKLCSHSRPSFSSSSSAAAPSRGPSI